MKHSTGQVLAILVLVPMAAVTALANHFMENSLLWLAESVCMAVGAATFVWMYRRWRWWEYSLAALAFLLHGAASMMWFSSLLRGEANLLLLQMMLTIIAMGCLFTSGIGCIRRVVLERRKRRAGL